MLFADWLLWTALLNPALFRALPCGLHATTVDYLKSEIAVVTSDVRYGS